MLFMKLNYEVEWELEDEVIDNMVNEVEDALKQYPDCSVDACIYDIVTDSLDDMGIDDCDHFNMDCYLDKVTEEVKKRYLDRKQKATVIPATMKTTGIVRRIDDLGRIVIPKEIRRAMRSMRATHLKFSLILTIILFLKNITDKIKWDLFPFFFLEFLDLISLSLIYDLD